MKNTFMVIPVVLLYCLAVGCSQCGDVAEEPKADVEADIKAIKDIIADYNASMNSSNIDRLMLHYAQNAIRIPPNEAAVIGIEAIRDHIQQMFDEFMLKEKNTVESVKVSGYLGVAHVLWSATIEPKIGGDSLEYTGNWISAFEKQSSGAWKIIYSAFSNEQLVYPDQAK